MQTLTHTYQAHNGLCSECFAKREAVEDGLVPYVCYMRTLNRLEGRVRILEGGYPETYPRSLEGEVISRAMGFGPGERLNYVKSLVERLLATV